MVETVETARAPAAFITQAVGDVTRPRAGLPLHATGLDALPGKLGVIHGVSNALGWMRNGRDHMLAQVRRYGTVYKYSFAKWPVVFVADPELIADILRNEDRAWSAALAWRIFFEGLDPEATYMDGLGTVDFEVHRAVRKWLQPAFSGDALKAYMATATPMLERAIARWRAAGRVSFKAEVRRLFAKVAGRIFLGVDDDGLAEMLDRALADYWRAPLALVRHRLASPTWRKAQDGGKRMYDWLLARVPERRTGSGTDLFTRMCQTEPNVDWITDDGIVRVMMSVLAGAFDTTSCAVTSMGYELANNPAWQTRLREHPAELDWAWKETLRRYPVAPDVPRRALRDIDLGRYRVPAGAMVLSLIAAVMNDPARWTSPDRFDPERFSPDRAEDKRQKGLFLPFGSGVHACIGAQLSTQEALALWEILLAAGPFRLERPYEARHEFAPLGMVSGDVGLTFT